MSWTHLSDRTLKARKPYQCELCDRPIAVGEPHVNRTGVMDGDIYRFRMHVACEEETRGWEEDDWKCHDVSEFRRMIDEGSEVQESDRSEDGSPTP